MSRRRHIRRRIKLLLALNIVVVAGLVILLLVNWRRHELTNVHSGAMHGNGIAYADDRPSSTLRMQSRQSPSSYFPRSQPSRVRSLATKHGHIALVIDDLGFSLSSQTIQGVINLPVPLTIGVIPGLAASDAVAEAAYQHGHEILVHLPMEPVGDRDDTIEYELHSGMSASEFSVFMDSMTTIPHATGLSNHQGSAATQDRELMDRVSDWCSQRGWYVFDSITHPGSVLYRAAERARVPAFRRDLFLDHYQDPDSIRAQLHAAVQLAERRQGLVVLVGHPRSSTLTVLQEELPGLVEQGVRFMRLREGSTLTTEKLAVEDR